MTTTVNLQYKLLQDSNALFVELRLLPHELQVIRDATRLGSQRVAFTRADVSLSASAHAAYVQLCGISRELDDAQAAAKDPDVWTQLSKGLGKALDHMESAEREVLRDCDA